MPRCERREIFPSSPSATSRTQLRLVSLMRDGEVCVCFFTEVLQAPQPTISRHLAYLRRAGVVSERREGKWMHYRIVDPPDPRAARVFHEICSWIGEEPEMRHDCESIPLNPGWLP